MHGKLFGITALVALFAFLLAGIAPAVEVDDVSKVAQGYNDFGLSLYRQLAGKSSDNLFFSPYSIATALSITYAGARGETGQAMAKTLRVPFKGKLFHQASSELGTSLNVRGKKGNYTLTVANRLWLRQGKKVNPDFLTIVQRYYSSGVEYLNFAANPENARQAINTWVAKKTNDKIKDLIPPGVLGKDTEFVLTNAIYFLGNWDRQFSGEGTRDAQFNTTAKKQVTVKMMYQKEHFQYLSTEDLQILELPYKGKELALVVLLPKKVDGLSAVEKKLSTSYLNACLGKLSRKNVHVYLPKFRMTENFNLAAVLKAMGMASAFGKSADFSGIAPDIALSEVVHKAYVDVNERGTEAAAATGVIGITANGEETVTFRADRPFIFLIRDKVSGSILFMGRLVNPEK